MLKIIINEKNRSNHTIIKSVLSQYYNINRFYAFFDIKGNIKIVGFTRIKKNDIKTAAALYLIK